MANLYRIIICNFLLSTIASVLGNREILENFKSITSHYLNMARPFTIGQLYTKIYVPTTLTSSWKITLLIRRIKCDIHEGNINVIF
jgi:ABC-type amino acid transport system permease subunit